MEFMDSDLQAYMKELQYDNLYVKLSYDEQVAIEDELKESIEVFSRNIEGQINSSLWGVKLEFVDILSLSVNSDLADDGIYRGIIHCSRLLLIANYQMFYSMNYQNIVIDGKNIEEIRKIIFHMSMMCIFYHELAHIYKGHLHLYKQWNIEKTVDEHYLDIKTLEWDADSYAATQIAVWINRVNREYLSQDKTDFFMKIACGAIHGMMYWQRTCNDFDNLEHKEHLPIFFREVVIINCIGEVFNNTETILGYIYGYEREFNKVRNVKNIEIKQYFVGSNENDEWIEKIENNWERVKSMLREYSAFPLQELENINEDFIEGR